MTASLPRFLLQLAPWAGHRDGAVHAALPPRFSTHITTEDVGAVQRDAERGPAIGDARAAPSTARPPVERVESAIEPAASSPVFENTQPAPPREIVNVIPAPRVVVATPAAPPEGPRGNIQFPPIAPDATTDVVEHRSRPSIETTTRVERIAVVNADAPRPAAAPHQAAPSPMSASMRPLRDEAIADRAPSVRAERPTVVEVTIDRIDVRVPPPSSTPSRPATRRVVPTQTLGEYLRERDRGTR